MKMSTQMRAFAPATRVMSRNEPPTAASGSCPSMVPARPGSRAGSRARAAGGWSAPQAVVGARRDRHRDARRSPSARRPGRVAGRIGLRDRRQEPGRAVEDLRPRAAGAAGLGAADGMPADEAAAVSAAMPRTRFALVEPMSVTVAAGASRASAPRPRPAAGRRGADDDQVGVRAGRADGVVHRRDAAALERLLAHAGSGSKPTTVRLPRSRARGRATRPSGPTRRSRSDADHAGQRRRRRISSATRKARSSDWRAFSRGSQSVCSACRAAPRAPPRRRPGTR